MYGAIILAGGRGTRFKGKKQFIKLKGKFIWQHVFDKTVEILENDNIVVVGIDIPGGDTRSLSVINGLNFLDPKTSRVIILEAARPLVTKTQIEELLSDEHPSTSFVIPLVNTVVRKDGIYLNRDELLELQTPQAFDYRLLKEAYDSKKFFNMTDETRVMNEYHGLKPHFILGGQNLIKLTYKKDLPIIKEIYKQQKKGEV